MQTKKCRLELLKTYVDKFLLTIDHPTPYRGSLPYKFYFEVYENMLDDMYVSSIKNEEEKIVVRTVSSEKFLSDAAIIEHMTNVLFEKGRFCNMGTLNHRLKNLGYRMNCFPTGNLRGQVSTILVMADPIDEITAAIQMGCVPKEIIQLIDELDDADLLVLEHVKFGSPIASMERLVSKESKYLDVLAHMKSVVGKLASQRGTISED